VYKRAKKPASLLTVCEPASLRSLAAAVNFTLPAKCPGKVEKSCTSTHSFGHRDRLVISSDSSKYLPTCERCDRVARLKLTPRRLARVQKSAITITPLMK
jgi:hypothetical protein